MEGERELHVKKTKRRNGNVYKVLLCLVHSTKLSIPAPSHTHIHTTQGIILVALVRRNGENLEEILFWGIRLTVVSTALNPFVYGLLARQYRLAYYYVLRLWASSCCRCVDPPLKDVFGELWNNRVQLVKRVVRV